VTAATPRPFTVRVPDGVLADLRQRLGPTRWPEEPGALAEDLRAFARPLR
jgi:hypothetical protein